MVTPNPAPRHNPQIVLLIRVICPIRIHITQESHWWSSSKLLRRKKNFSTKWSSWLTFSVPHWQKSIHWRGSDGNSFWIFLILYGWNLNRLRILYTEDVPMTALEANFGLDLIWLTKIFAKTSIALSLSVEDLGRPDCLIFPTEPVLSNLLIHFIIVFWAGIGSDRYLAPTISGIS